MPWPGEPLWRNQSWLLRCRAWQYHKNLYSNTWQVGETMKDRENQSGHKFQQILILTICVPWQVLQTLRDERQLRILESPVGWTALPSSFQWLSACKLCELREKWLFTVDSPLWHFLGLRIFCWNHQLAGLHWRTRVLLCHCGGWLCLQWRESGWGLSHIV